MPHLPAWPIWKVSPFIRLIVPLITGITCQWYLPLTAFSLWLLIAFCAIALRLFSAFSLSRQYRAQWHNGLWLHAILFAIGGLLLYYSDVRNQSLNITRHYDEGKG